MTNEYFGHDVASVLVTYNPNLETLRATLLAVLPQVAKIFIVDNASSNVSEEWLAQFNQQNNSHVQLLPQSDNFGIATAHNIGIRHAITQGAKFILLLDQDSQITHDMVHRLHVAYDKLADEQIAVAAIGVRYRDSDTGAISPFVTAKSSRFVECACSNDVGIVFPDFLISSGSLLSVAALQAVGLMDDELFIDHVDTEWCYRAKSKAWVIAGLCDTVMTHSLGNQREVVWRSRKRRIPFHKPFRYYYMFRNSLLLYRRDYMPSAWKKADFISRVKMLIFFACMTDNERWQRLNMMLLGILDGLKNRQGKRVF